MATKNNKLVNTNASQALTDATKELQRVGTHGQTQQSRRALGRFNRAINRVQINGAINDWLKNNRNGNGS